MTTHHGWAILKAWEHGAFCRLCGKPLRLDTYGQIHPEAATLDHIVHRAHGGGNGYDNMQLAHRLCNTSKHLPPLRPDQFARLSPEAQRQVLTWKAKLTRQRRKKAARPKPTTTLSWRCAKCARGAATRQQAYDCCQYGWRQATP